MMNPSRTPFPVPEVDRVIRRLPHERLGNLELHVFLRIARGQTLPEVVRTLGTSLEAVGMRRPNILAKTELPHDDAIVCYAVFQKLIADDDL